MKDISIIMPFLNEREEPQNTIDSIYQTAHPKRFEIIAIDDCSDEASKIYESKEIKIVRNKHRIGVDACRQLGAEMATSPNLFIIDAHMRFPKGWMSRMISNIQSEPSTLWCTTCMGLGYGNMDLHRSRDRYRGADIVLLNGSQEILEPKWRNVHAPGKYEIPCVLGANYGISKSWFEHIHGLKGLKMWGGSEMFMSLKTWMAGGCCKIDTDIHIGHKFRDNAPYATGAWNITYNKLYICDTILPNDIGEYLKSRIPNSYNRRRADKEIERNKQEIASEKSYYTNIFKRDLYSICDQWRIPIPCLV
ncbi:MAG: glycosyltransferase [Synergistaceae bacterium]